MFKPLIAALLVVWTVSAAHAERRVALVFGNDEYSSLRPLRNAVSDARLVEATLKGLSFSVTIETDRDLRRMRRALDDFREDAGEADVALVYFAGHGAEIDGDNRLIPIDADASSLPRFRETTLPLNEVQATLTAVSKTALILLDACRNDPFNKAGASGRGVMTIAADVVKATHPGFGRIGRADNTLFAFSAAPGQTSSDGSGANSPFSTALAKYLGASGVEVRSALTLVQQEVFDRTRGTQLPYIENGLPRLFFAKAADGELPERERLLLAMAGISADLRGDIQSVAEANSTPLAPLYAAALQSDLAKLASKERTAKLTEAAVAFNAQRNELRLLSSSDPEVTRLRTEADQQLELGAYEKSRELTAKAAAVDSNAAKRLSETAAKRRLSEAATHYLGGGMALSVLHYEDAAISLERARDIYDRFSHLETDDRDRQISGLRNLIRIYTRTGNTTLAEDAMQSAISLMQRGFDSKASTSSWRDELVQTYYDRSLQRRVNGDPAGSYSDVKAGLYAAIQLAASENTNLERQEALGVHYSLFVRILRSLDKKKEALDAANAGMEVFHRLTSFDPSNVKWKTGYVQGLASIASLQRDGGNKVDGDNKLEQAILLQTEFTKQRPNDPILIDALANLFRIRGQNEQSDRRIEDALKSFEQYYSITKSLAEAHPEMEGARSNLSMAIAIYSGALSEAGHDDMLLPLRREDMAIREELVERSPEDAYRQRDLAASYHALGSTLVEMGKTDEGISWETKALEIRKKIAAVDTRNREFQVALHLNYQALADAYSAKEAFTEAAMSLRKSLDIYRSLEPTFGTDLQTKYQLADWTEKIGDFEFKGGDSDAAAKQYAGAVPLLAEVFARSKKDDTISKKMALLYLKAGALNVDPATNLPASLELSVALRDKGVLNDGIVSIIRNEIKKRRIKSP